MSVQEYRLDPEITELIGNAVGSRNPLHQFEVMLRDGNGRTGLSRCHPCSL